MSNNNSTKVTVICVGIGIILFSSLIYALVEKKKRWTVFVKEHHCEIVSHQSGDITSGVGIVVSPSGTPSTVITTHSTPSKTGWLCDDGVTYWR